MSATPGLVNSTIRFSAVDGPGNRFVIFAQGCNFNCITCHNPYTITECTSCGVCVGSCPETALTIHEGPQVAVDRVMCTRCDICIDVCPEDSTPLAEFLEIGTLMTEIRSVAPFISGVTVSGGEATQQPAFIESLFRTIKNDSTTSHLTTLIDSNGSAPIHVWDSLMDVMDGAMIDLKALDPEVHVRLTARGNAEVLRSIAYLAQHDKLNEVRLLIVPGYNDGPDDAKQAAVWLRDIDPGMKIKIIGYRAHGVRPEAFHIPDTEPSVLADISDIFNEHGFGDLTVV